MEFVVGENTNSGKEKYKRITMYDDAEINSA